MANAIIVKLTSASWKGAPVAGATTMSFSENVQIVADGSDGAVFPKLPAKVVTDQTVTVGFLYADKLMGMTIGDTGALVCTGKMGNGANDVVITVGAAMLTSRQLDASGGGGTATFTAYSTNGTTNPVVVT